jgi:osmotically-inducible protein OsmY
MTNDRPRAAVAAKLSWNPRVDSKDITVSADGGRVTLHGTVTSCRQKREAGNAARRVHGVAGISSYLEVHIPDRDRRADADVRADVRQALALNDLIPATVQARVEAGFVTLSGVAAWQFQRDEAELACAAVLARHRHAPGGDQAHRGRRPNSAIVLVSCSRAQSYCTVSVWPRYTVSITMISIRCSVYRRLRVSSVPVSWPRP